MATLKRGGSALSAQDQTDIRRDLGLGTAATAAASDFATAAQGTDSREWTAATVDQAEAEAGTATTRRAWTAVRVRQAIAAWWTSASTAAGRAIVTAADAAAQRTALGLGTAATTTAPGIVAVSANVTINSGNAATYNGQTLVWSGAFTVTLAAGLPTGFGFAGRPPATGNASVAVTGGPTLDGATATITRALASNKLFAVQGIAADTYTATGS